MQDGKHVILCIDDDPDVLVFLRAVLEDHDYIMVGASSAEEALKRYRESNPDFVIVDLMMEEIDAGAGFAIDLQAMGNTVPVYMLSSAGDSLSETLDSTHLGLAGVFQKPVDPDELITILKTRLS